MGFVECPLLGREIEDGICFDITMVAEGTGPKWTAPDEATAICGFEAICLRCKNHRE